MSQITHIHMQTQIFIFSVDHEPIYSIQKVKKYLYYYFYAHGRRHANICGWVKSLPPPPLHLPFLPFSLVPLRKK